MPRLGMRRPRGFIALAGLATLTAAAVGLQAQAPPSAAQKQTIDAVVALLEQEHMSHPEINDEVAKRTAENFIESLDPLKFTFLKADVDALLAESNQIDDQLRKGDISWARKAFQLFLTRSDERLAAIKPILERKPDFTLDETIVDDVKLLDYPKTAEEASERLRKQIKLDMLQLKVSKTDEEDTLKRLRLRYFEPNRYYKLFNDQDLLERYLTSLTMAVDPHSAYWQATTLEDMLGTTLHLSLEGIGASLQSEDGYPVVKEIVPGGAADKDGRLQPEDKILGVETDDGHKDEFIGKKLSDVVRKIRGPAGTKVRLLVQPADSKEVKVYELTRQKIELVEQKAKGQVLEAKDADGKPIKIGVISLPSFYGDGASLRNNAPDAVSATGDCKRLLDEFKEQHVNAVIMDLRGNGGGLLKEAIMLSGLFIDHGPVVQIKESTGVKHHDDDDRGTAWDGPMVVLIDHLSASASEIFAGVIQDYDRGLVIGDSSTYGKGTVQSIIRLNEILPRLFTRNAPDLGALKLTIQQFYRANGESTQIRGVRPDIHIPSPTDFLDIGEGKNETALKYDKVAPLPHDDYRRVPEELLEKLRARSEERREENPKFQAQSAAIERLKARKAKHEITLNEEKFRAETAALESEKDEAESAKGKKKRHAEHPAWESNFYNDEILAIIGDYLSLGGDLLFAGPVRDVDPAQLPLRP